MGKPKLCLIQACGSYSLEKIEKLDCFDASKFRRDEILIPNGVDQLVMYATSQVSSAIENSVARSYMVKVLCEQIEKNPEKDFISILTIVVRKLLSKTIIHSKTRDSNKFARHGAVIVS